MVTDWFAGKEIATAMAIFVNSWPAGIAVALVVLPVVVGWGGVAAVGMATVVVAALGLVLLALLYAPPVGQVSAAGSGVWPAGAALQAVIVAGCIWGFYNAALSMVFGYGTALLTERGWSLTAAGSATSLVLWMVAISVPLGGILADRTGRPREIMLAGFALFGVVLVIAARSEAVIFWFVVLGLVGGLSAGPIMALPTRVLAPPARAVGMGLYFLMFYVMVVAGPIFRCPSGLGKARRSSWKAIAVIQRSRAPSRRDTCRQTSASASPMVRQAAHSSSVSLMPKMRSTL